MTSAARKISYVFVRQDDTLQWQNRTFPEPIVACQPGFDMRIMTDSPRKASMFLADSLSWPRVTAAALPVPDRDVWRTLGSTTEVWLRECESPPDVRFWPRLFVIDAAESSQFDALKQLGGGKEQPEPLAAVALSGRRFHGHRGRPWAAVAGNLHLCVMMAPRCPAARIGLAMTILPVVATVEAIRHLSAGRVQPGIKWVNDILVDGRKVAGVLTATQTQGSRLDLVILGLGINVERAPSLPPTPFVPAVGCLRDIPDLRSVTLPRLLWTVLAALASRYQALLRDGPDDLFAAYRRDSLIIGRRVRIWEETTGGDVEAGLMPAPLASGVVSDIRPDLSLTLAGRPDPVDKGRLALESACRELGL
jgi:biotin-[acetyl-CoA-carboxylase] ligase BirA-like protein